MPVAHDDVHELIRPVITLVVFERAFGEWGDDEWDSVHKTFWDWL